MAGLSDENDKFDIRNSSVPFDTVLTNINTHDDYKPYNEKTGQFPSAVSMPFMPTRCDVDILGL